MSTWTTLSWQPLFIMFATKLHIGQKYLKSQIQHEGLVHSLKCYIETNYKNTLISNATNTIPNVKKWLTNENIYPRWSNFIWDAPWIMNAQLTQTFNFRYGRYLGNYRRKDVMKQDISPICDLFLLKQSHKFTTAYTSSHVAQINT